VPAILNQAALVIGKRGIGILPMAEVSRAKHS
jgi:hypothetical protein